MKHNFVLQVPFWVGSMHRLLQVADCKKQMSTPNV